MSEKIYHENKKTEKTPRKKKKTRKNNKTANPF